MVSKSDEDADDLHHPGPREIPWPHRCFFCGKEVTGVFVWWRGVGETIEDNILLHSDCAANLGAYLIADANKASGIPIFTSSSRRSD